MAVYYCYTVDIKRETDRRCDVTSLPKHTYLHPTCLRTYIAYIHRYIFGIRSISYLFTLQDVFETLFIYQKLLWCQESFQVKRETTSCSSVNYVTIWLWCCVQVFYMRSKAHHLLHMISNNKQPMGIYVQLAARDQMTYNSSILSHTDLVFGLWSGLCMQNYNSHHM